MNISTPHLGLGKIVVATRNLGKLREFQALLNVAGSLVVGLTELALNRQVEETGETFAENASLKALAYSLDTDLPVLADDSGLEVFSLSGCPGVRSARYAGPDTSDADRVRKLLGELEHAAEARDARFVCALALAQKGMIICEAEGECRGEIAHEPHGAGGFGYDPIFFVPELGETFAELAEEVKNRTSHRARAVTALLAKLGIH